MKNNWIQISAKGPSERKDEAVIILINAGSPGVLEEDDPPAIGKVIPHSVGSQFEDSHRPIAACRAYLGSNNLHRLGGLKKELKKIGWRLSSSQYREEDWSLRWRRSIRPVRVSYRGSSVIVKPTWKRVKKTPGAVVIEIDPGMAFGTGRHPTTKMCLKAVLRILKDDKAASKKFLDIGAGTGVLAIAAGKLKVRKVSAVDIDPAALKACRANARLNGVKLSISGAPVERLKGRYSVVVSNILAGELTRLSPHIAGRVCENGYLLLSGVLRGEETGIVKTYESLGLRLLRTCFSGEWAANVFVNDDSHEKILCRGDR